MTRRNKLLKFADLHTFSNVFQFISPESPLLTSSKGEVNMKGQWAIHFGNDHPITLELACGRGEYCLGLARKYPNKNYIGVDIKGARIWKGAQTAIAQELHNVAFIRTRVEFLANYLERDEISEIWITFPDPFLKSSKYNRRLTSPNYLRSYQRYLLADGPINLKTDSPQLYDHTKEVLDELSISPEEDNSNIYAMPTLPHPDLDILTYYEKKHLHDQKTIKYIRFLLKTEM